MFSAYFIVLSGVSSWSTTISLFFIASILLSISSSLTSKLAPGETTIEFWAFLSTVISATPVAPFEVCIYVVSTLSFFSEFIRVCPNPSSPTLPIIDTFPFNLAIATAWLAPFPPGTSLKLLPIIVCPGFGIVSTLTTKSIFKLPITHIFFIIISLCK